MNREGPQGTKMETDKIIKLAVMAVGGQGGGVLTGWIEALARAAGFAVQSTSVAGVAQRTGATIYYVEMIRQGSGTPVFALAPSAGDVDIVIAAEMMEVGRAVLRGFVTPDRTTLIGSTHRQLAVSEKTVPGDGIANAAEVRAAAEIAAQRLILADMDHLAILQGSVISASLFGALAGSGALPFPRAAFEAAIRAGGKGVEPSLRAFAAGYDAAQAATPPPAAQPSQQTDPATGSAAQRKSWEALLPQVAALPHPVRPMARSGLAKVVDFQDCDYGQDYLTHLNAVIERDGDANQWELSTAAAKYIANAMAYDDIIRVSDLKTRRLRFTRIRDEMGAQEDQVLQLTEYFHPRAEEVTGMLPARLGARIEANRRAMDMIERMFGKGRHLRTDTLPAFTMLHVLGGLKRYRLRTRRHELETAHLNAWLERALAQVDRNYPLAVEVLKCRRLIKGYSDTHARGLSKFDTVLAAVDLLQHRDDAAVWIARLREAALQDSDGTALEGAIRTVRSFAEPDAGG